MLKNYNYMLTILLYPFIMVLSYLKLSDLIRGNLYNHLIIILLIIFIPSFIMSLYDALEEILGSNKKWRIVLLIFLSIFYLPVYYTKYVSKEEKYLGYLLFIVMIPLTYITMLSCHKSLLNYFNEFYQYKRIVVKDIINYNSIDDLFSIKVDSSFRCNQADIGDYVISCDRLEDNSFIGIYSYDISYDSSKDIEEKLVFHINQTIDYIKDGGYLYNFEKDNDVIRIFYSDNVILIKQKNYYFEDVKYSLIIMKEMPKDNLDYEEYQKMIDSIQFLNYNDGVSS